MWPDDTPAQTPLSKKAEVDPDTALSLLLEHLINRMRVLDRAHIYIIDKLENPPDGLSLVRLEREELHARSRALLQQWHMSIINDVDTDRPSQANIAITNVFEPPKTSRTSAPFGSARTRRVIAVIFFTLGSIAAGYFSMKGESHGHQSSPVPENRSNP